MAMQKQSKEVTNIIFWILNLCSSSVNSQRLLCSQKAGVKYLYESFLVSKFIDLLTNSIVKSNKEFFYLEFDGLKSYWYFRRYESEVFLQQERNPTLVYSVQRKLLSADQRPLLWQKVKLLYDLNFWAT